MSRGLGKIERKILKLFQDQKKEDIFKDTMFAEYIVWDIFYPDHFNKGDENHPSYDPEYKREHYNLKPTKSQYQSVYRALRRLEDKQFITKVWGGSSHLKKVMCLPKGFSKHLEEENNR